MNDAEKKVTCTRCGLTFKTAGDVLWCAVSICPTTQQRLPTWTQMKEYDVQPPSRNKKRG